MLKDSNIKAPRVSVVVPVYNGEKYLEEALLSIKQQTFEDFECLVVDDGSLNKTYISSVLNHLKDPRFKSFRKENGGVATALNLGISKAKGELFCWLSHDDLWESTKLEVQVGAYLQDQILCSNYTLIDENAKVLAVTNFEKTFDVTTGMSLLSRGLIHGCSIMLPMSLFEKIGTFNPKLKYTQDYDLWLRAIKSGYKFNFQNFPTTVGRIHTEQTGKISDTRIENSHLWAQIIDEWYKIEILQKNLTTKDALLEIEIFRNWARNSSLIYASEVLDLRMKHLIEDIKVSVVIPYRDRVSTLSEAVSSVNAQSHRNLEVIVIDDSHDAGNPTDKLLESLVVDPDIPIRIVENLKTGVSSARNLGINLSQGEFIAFLDSDDFFLPTKIATQLIEIVKCDALFSHTNYIRIEEQTGSICDTSANSGSRALETLADNCTVATPTVMLKKLVGIENLFDPSILLGEDSDAWIRFIGKFGNHISHLKTPLTVVRTTATSSRYNQESIGDILSRNRSSVMFYSSRKRKYKMRFRQFCSGVIFYTWRTIGRPAFLKDNWILRQILMRIRGF